jgi:D-beta-D-heptose 7-phosphate kinase/D-beta-D-heptose 1-phosphate adenosyltransferase
MQDDETASAPRATPNGQHPPQAQAAATDNGNGSEFGLDAESIGAVARRHAGLSDAVQRLSRASVLVVGDAMLDRYVYGTVERISPEAPIPIVTVEREIAMPGGAGNVVRNLTALGAAVAFVSVVGDDQAGSDLTGLIGGQPNVEPWLLVQGGRETTVKTRYLAQGQHLLRADREVTAAIHPKLGERMMRITRDALAATSATILSDYRKGVLSGDIPAQIIAAARAAGRPVIVDPKGPDYSRYAGADIVTPNRRELAEATGMDVSGEAELVAAAEALRQRHGFRAVLVTRAQDGMTLVDENGALHLPAEAAEVFDVSGAGDTVVATLAAGIAAGLDLPTSARLANLAAGIVVGKVGTAVARPSDLLAALSTQGGALRKIVSREAAAEQVERWRRRGWRTGFTNGCFDLLHPGHIHLLEQARAGCDRLVVGINSDASTRRLKGPTRPVQPEAARAAVLASLASVDLVCVFEEDTPETLIAALRPELLVKGADYTLDRVVGAEQVQSWGGRVMLANLLPGHSTTATVARLRG